MRSTIEEYLKVATSQYLRRRLKAATQILVDNASLLAGSPMTFYCGSCGIYIETLPEDYLMQPYSLCSQCQGLRNEGLLAEVKRRAYGLQHDGNGFK